MSYGPFTGYLGYCDNGTCTGFFSQADQTWMACAWPQGYEDGDQVVVTFDDNPERNSCCMEQSPNTFTVVSISKIIPLTAVASSFVKTPIGVSIGGKQYISSDVPGNSFLFNVFDRASLAQLACVVTSDCVDVPPAIATYLGSSQYLLVVVTNVLASIQIPQGPLYDALRTNGGGPGLARLEQVIAQWGTGYFNIVTYVLVSAMGVAGASFDSVSFDGNDGAVVTVGLVLQDGKYTPQAL